MIVFAVWNGKIEVSISEVDFFDTQTECCTNASWSEFKYRNRDFVIIIIYVIFNLISYLTSSPVAEYEVGQGTIATNHIYHGLILRDETVVYAGQSGYINYYLKNGAKASVNDVVYSIDTSGELSRQISDVTSNGDTLDTETLNEVSSELDVSGILMTPTRFLRFIHSKTNSMHSWHRPSVWMPSVL